MLLLAALLAWAAYNDTTNGTILSAGLTRRYLLHVPKRYDRSMAAPLVISFHPAATWPALVQHISRWNDVADAHGFIVVYPAGTGAFFGGVSRGPHVFPLGPQSRPRDMRFVSDLVDRLSAEYHIDPDRIYANGMSNGGSMAVALSCDRLERIAAVATVAGAFPADFGCGDSRPVPTMEFHGTADRLAPYGGGKSPVAPRPFVGIRDWAAGAARRNHCSSNPTETRVAPSVRRLAYTNCADAADVILYTIDGGGHTWPGGEPLAAWLAGPTTDEIDATRLAWDFFAAHPRATSRPSAPRDK